jgi:hypothetical protein
MSKNSDCICSKCYAFEIESVFTNIHIVQTRNFKILNNIKIEPNTFKRIRPVRFNSIGELGSDLHLENLIGIVNHNPHIQFSLWTKRISIVNRVFDQIERPKNLILIYSSKIKNVRTYNIDNKVLRHFNKIFTVYTLEYAKKNKIKINCGKRHCIKCMLCYSDNKVKYINEYQKRSIGNTDHLHLKSVNVS